MASRHGRIVLAAGVGLLTALSTIALTPTAASAAQTATISGTVRESAPGSWAVGGQRTSGAVSGRIDVYTSSCRRVGTARVVWSGARFSVKLPKRGSYKLVYRDLTTRTSRAVPYGLGEAWYGGGVGCRAATAIRVDSGAQVRGRSIVVRARGALQVVGATLWSSSRARDRYEVFSARSGERLATIASSTSVVNLPAGSYRVAVARYSSVTKRSTILRVLGTNSTRLAQGRVISLSPAVAMQADMRTGRAAVKRDLLGASVVVDGTGEIGEALSATLMTVPVGVTARYQWSQVPGGAIAGATRATYVVRSADRDTSLRVTATVSSASTLTRVFSSPLHTVRPPRLHPVVAQDVSTTGAAGLVALDPLGSRLTGGQVGDTLTVAPARFEPEAVEVSYAWRAVGADTVIGSEDSLTLAPELAGQAVAVTVTYARPGYPTVTRTTEIAVAARNALPELVLRTDQELDGDLRPAPEGAGYDVDAFPSVPLSLGAPATFVGSDGEVREAPDPECTWSRFDEFGAEAVMLTGSCMLSIARMEGVAGQVIQFSVRYVVAGYQDAVRSTRIKVSG